MSQEMMQVYWVGTRGGDREARPGQFIFHGDDDTVLRGFIGEVDAEGERILIYLFEPIVKADFAEVVHACIDESVWSDKLVEVLEHDPEMKTYWFSKVSGQGWSGTKMTDTEIRALVAKTQDMLSFRRAATITHYIQQTAHVVGDIVEFGCYRGHTAALMAALSDKPIWLYDSFEGLPADQKSWEVVGNFFKPGTLACTVDETRRTMDEVLSGNKGRLTIVKGWFKDLNLGQLPTMISLAHIDGDYYSSTTDALRLVVPRLSLGGVCIVDDYDFPNCPGVKRAVDEFIHGLNRVVTVPSEQIALCR
jgi:hypothetical protein